MSSWTSLIDLQLLVLVWASVLAMEGGPLLWRFLNYQPVTRCAVLLAVSNAVGSGCGMMFCFAVINARERGLISLFTTVLALAILFGSLIGRSFLIARWGRSRRDPSGS